MYNYYSEFENLSKESPLEMPQHNAPVPPLAERAGKAGSKIFSRDQIHPNDEGYDYWGRYIASAIVDQWKAIKQSNQ
jgi:lysophospholipase L1-like esterase